MSLVKKIIAALVSMSMATGLLMAGTAVTTAAMVAGASPAQAANSAVTLNSAGGSSDGDGIKIEYQGGRYQIKRNGTGQIYGPNSPASNTFSQTSLAVLDLDNANKPKPASSKFFSSRCSTGVVSCLPFTSIDTTGSSTTGSGSFSSVLSGNLDGMTYSVKIDVNYIYPKDYFTQTYTVTIPEGNTKTVRLYNGYDTYLEGGDAGPGFYNADPQQVGVKKTAIEALQHAGGQPWESYYSGSYGTALSRPSSGLPYNNEINTNPNTDNGIAVNWNFGSTPGVKTPASNYFVFVNSGSPNSPRNVDATPAPESLVVTWDHPSSGPNPDEYTATATVPGSDESYSCTAAYPNTTCTIEGLDPDLEYEVTVTPSNGSGSGLPSNPTPPIQPEAPLPPGQPGQPTAAATGAGEVTVSVDPPTTGGTPSSYLIRAFDESGNLVEGKTCTVTHGTDPLACAVSGLDPSQKYRFDVIAQNSVGDSAESQKSELVQANVPPGAPGTPSVSVSADGVIDIDIAPSTSGGAADTYTVQAFENGSPVDGKFCTVPASTNPLGCSIEGLDGETAYTFSVIANNEMGDSSRSPPSDSIVPGPPSDLPAPAGEAVAPGTVKVTAEPAAGGGPANSYVIQAFSADGSTAIEGAACSVDAGEDPIACEISGLDTHTNYTFKSKGINGAGESDEYSPASAPVLPNLPPSVPGTPVASLNASGNVKIKISSSTQGGVAESYTVQAYDDGVVVDGKTCTVTSPLPNPLACNITGLDPATAYTFKVVADNNTGVSSPASPASNTIVPGPPATPAAPTLTVNEVGTITVRINPQSGGGTASSYTVKVFPGPKTCTIPASADPLECVFTGLDPKVQYEFKSFATNVAGNSAQSAVSSKTYPNLVPSKPGTPVAEVSGEGSAKINFTPSTEGGTPTSYIVRAYLDGVAVPDKQCTVSATANPLTCNIAGLDPTIAYTFGVEGINNMGPSVESDQSNAVIPTSGLSQPGVPVVVPVSPGVMNVTVTPADTGGSPNEYVITASPGGATCTVAATANPLTCQIGGLNPNTQYTFKTVAKNALVSSEASAPSAAKYPNVVPSVPGKAHVVLDGANGVKINIAPSTQGGAADTYTVTSIQDPSKTCTVPATTSPLACTIAGLPPGDTATFTVVANNNSGTSPISVPSSPIKPGPPNATGAPTVVVHQPGDVAVTVTTPPASGGTPSSYLIQAFQGINPVAGKSCTVNASLTPLTCAMSGLDVNTEYTFHAKSINPAGESVWSEASDVVVPNVAPGAPGTPSATVSGMDSAVVTVPASSSGGVPSSYEVEALVDGEPVSPALTCTISNLTQNPLTCEVSGLDHALDYTFRARGINSADEGSWSPQSNAVRPDGAPGTPGKPSAMLNDEPGQVKINISPSTTGGTPHSYTVRAVEDTSKTCTVLANANPLECVIVGLDATGTYTFQSHAANLADESAWSQASDPVTPTGIPGEPGQPTVAVDQVGGITVTVLPSDSGAPAVEYVVQVFDGGTPVPDAFCIVQASAVPLECSISGLNPNAQYTVRTLADNASGQPSALSDPSSSFFANVAPDVPGVPVPSVSGDGEVTITVPPSGGEAGSPTSYTVEVLDAAGDPLAPVVTCSITDVSAEPLACSVSDLDPGTDYMFRARGNNSGGFSAWVDSVNVVDPAGAPGDMVNPPTVDSDTPGEATVTVNPAISGGGTPSDYVVNAYDGDNNLAGSCEVLVGANPLSCVIADLDENAQFTFDVTPRNDAGQGGTGGQRSPPFFANVAPDVPGVPVPSVSGDGEVTITVPPSGDGAGSPTSYTVEVLDAAGDPLAPVVTCSITDVSAEPLACSVSDLDPGTDYMFRARGNNSGGFSAWVDSVNVVDPAGAPGDMVNPPTVDSDTPGEATVTVNPAISGGGTPSDYVVNAYDGDNNLAGSCEVLVGANPLSCVIADLDENAEFTFDVTPRNDAGQGGTGGQRSPPFFANVAPDAPGTPSAVVSGAGEVTITVPESSGGGTSTTYTVEALVDGQPVSPTPMTCTINTPLPDPLACSISGLDEETQYTFRAQGNNSAGPGDWSDESNLVGPGTPGQPGVPEANVLEPGVIRVTVLPPSGGGTPDGYTVTSEPGGFTCTVAANAVPLACDVEGLNIDEIYSFTVIAFNDAGDSVASPESNEEQANRVPGQPGTPHANVSGDGEVTITVPPADDGGAPIAYTVEALIDGQPVSPTPLTCTIGSPFPNPLACSISGLDEATDYTFRAQSDNSAGTGEWSEQSNEVEPAGTPDQPGVPTVTVPEPGELTVDVVPPSSGGTPDHYVVNVLQGDDVVDTCTLLANADPLECQFSGLDPEVEYTVEVEAVNDSDSSPIRSVGPIYPNALPAAPVAPQAVVSGDGDVNVIVTPPTGGGDPTSYTVEALVDGQPVAPTPITCTIEALLPDEPLACAFSGLDEGTDYTFRARGNNSAGDDAPWSDPSNAVTPDGVPGSPTLAPQAVVDEPGTITVTVEPVEDGGTPSEYVVTTEPGGATCTIQATADPLSCQISGLDPNESYTFNYNARNDAGDSPESSPQSDPIAPNNPPEPPPAPSAVVSDDGEATVTVEPSVGGPDADSYTIQAYVDGVPVDGASCEVEADADPLSCSIPGLDPNLEYEFTVQGENSAGFSETSDPSSPLTPGPPSAPNRPSVNSTEPGEITVTVDPTDGGGTPSSYRATVRDENGVVVPNGECTVLASADPLSCEISGLDPNEEYTVEVEAVNGAGDSVPSAPREFVPNTPPGTPGTPVADITGGGEVTVTVPPSTTGGEATSYVIEALVDGESLAPPVTCEITDVTQVPLTCVFEGLSEDTEYTFRAEAENAAGESDQSSPSNAVTPDGLPGIPGRPSVEVVAEGSVKIRVTPPTTGGAVDEYEVQALDGQGRPVRGKTCTVLADADPLTCNISGLNRDKAYTFVVVAESDLGSSDPSVPSAPTRPAKPNAPRAPSALVDGEGTVTVTVDPAPGGGTPSSYEVQAIDENGSPIDGATCTVLPTSDPLSCEIAGLDPNAPIRFITDAVNEAGSSSDSAPSGNVVPNVVPGAPGQPTAEISGEGEVTVNIVPSTDGGTPDSYTVSRFPGGGAAAESCTVAADAIPLACSFEGLDPDTDYTFTVEAENSAGFSETSPNSSNVVPGPPATPDAPQADAEGRGQVKVKVLPSGDGGTANQFIIRAVEDPSRSCVVDGDADPLECVISGLNPLEPYTFETSALNGINETPWSQPSSPVIPNVAPATPKKPRAEVNGEGKVRVTVDPEANGGMPSSYLVTSEPGGNSCLILPGALSCVVQGLDPTRSYRFSVEAENQFGDATSIASDPITPSRPSKPSAPQAKPAGDGRVEITIPRNSAGGTPSSYEVTAQPGGKKCIVLATASVLKCTISGLNPNATYRFAVKAINGAGASAASSLSSAVHPGGKRVAKSNAPRKMKITPKPKRNPTKAKTYKVSWLKPKGVSKNRPLDAYELTVQLSGSKTILIRKTLNRKVLSYNLTRKRLIAAVLRNRGEAGRYVFIVRIRGINQAGPGTPIGKRLIVTL